MFYREFSSHKNNSSFAEVSGCGIRSLSSGRLSVRAGFPKTFAIGAMLIANDVGLKCIESRQERIETFILARLQFHRF
jgi:hypothetical protein